MTRKPPLTWCCPQKQVSGGGFHNMHLPCPPGTGLESCKRPILFKISLCFPNKESTVPTAKRVGQLELTLGHSWLHTTVLPELSFILIKNLITSSELQEEMHFEGDKETWKYENCSRADLCRWQGLAQRVSGNCWKRLDIRVWFTTLPGTQKSLWDIREPQASQM